MQLLLSRSGRKAPRRWQGGKEGESSNCRGQRTNNKYRPPICVFLSPPDKLRKLRKWRRMVGGEGVWDWEMVWQLLQELVRSRKEALRCQQSLRDITSKKLEIRKLIGTIRPLRNLLNWHHSSLLFRKAAAYLELILPGWKKQVFEIINKFLLFFFFLVFT